MKRCFFKYFFLDGDHFKVYEFVTILLLFYVLVFQPQGIWELSFSARDQILTPCLGRRSLNHWTIRDIPPLCVLYFTIKGFKKKKLNKNNWINLLKKEKKKWWEREACGSDWRQRASSTKNRKIQGTRILECLLSRPNHQHGARTSDSGSKEEVSFLL